MIDPAVLARLRRQAAEYTEGVFSPATVLELLDAHAALEQERDAHAHNALAFSQDVVRLRGALERVCGLLGMHARSETVHEAFEIAKAALRPPSGEV